MPVRAAIYVDGFNLYHAISDMNQPYLKWLNLWRLGEMLAKGHAKSLERAVFCSAYFRSDFGKNVRHRAYVAALENVGVVSKLGHITGEPMECKRQACGHKWEAPREKETDINIALSMFDDAYQDLFDVAFLVSADTDQAATLRMMKMRFPQKRLISVVPPGRYPSKHLTDLSDAKINLTVNHIDLCALPALVTAEGRRTIPRPPEYAPPPGWVHPDDRPKK